MSFSSFLRNVTAPFRGGLFNLLGIDPHAKQVKKKPEKWIERSISPRGIELVKHFEGCFLTAYKDVVGVWTIGYGHTGLGHRDRTVHAGRKISQQEAEDLLKYDLATFCQRVDNGVDVPLTDDQFAALVSFDFNTGGFLRSTARKKLNAGDYQGAADELLKWDKAGGKKLKGLTRRRRSERNLFLGKSPFIERA